MSKSKETQIPLKILVDKARNKVLFAEADATFVKILFSFLTLPMGTIVRLVGENSESKFPSIGSFNTLYEGLANLPSECFWTEECKHMLLNPRNSSQGYCSQLKLNVDDTVPSKYFICGTLVPDYNCANYSMCNTQKCSCGWLFNKKICLRKYPGLLNPDYEKGDIFVNKTTTFIISDDLLVKPNLLGSTMLLINDLVTKGVTDFDEMTMTIGIQEILNLLRLALVSTCSLTNLFLRKAQTIQELVRCEPGGDKPRHRPRVIKQVPDNASSSNAKKFNAKAFVRKSNCKLLFVLAGGDFVDFLLSFLAIPLGTMEWLLSGTNIPPSVVNLYASLSNLDVGQYIQSQDHKDMLLQHPLAQKYLCKNQIFGLKEATSWDCYWANKSCSSIGFISPPTSSQEKYKCLTLKDLKWDGEFVRGTTIFMVADDLVVTPYSSISTFIYLHKLNIPLCDVEEHEVSIGIKEGLEILKASLTSSSALSSGLKHLLLKKPKQEK